MSLSIELFYIESIGRGRLAIMAHPGLPRDPARVIDAIADAGIGEVVSLLQAQESRSLGLVDEASLVTSRSMNFASFPIADMGLPASVNEFARLSWRLYRQIEGGVDTLLHCRGGIGRSGLLAAAVLLHDGRDVSAAFAAVAKARGRRVPETEAQGDWLQASHAVIVAAAAA